MTGHEKATLLLQDQEQTTCCWAFSIADTVGTNYATSNSLVKSQKQFRCSPQDLVDWVIIVKKLLKRSRIDKYGTYTCDPKHAFEYVNEHGVSLLRNYKVTIQEREFKTNRGLKEFEAMREAKGPRIFIKYGNILRRDVSTGILSTDAVFKFLSRGVVHGIVWSTVEGVLFVRGFQFLMALVCTMNLFILKIMCLSVMELWYLG